METIFYDEAKRILSQLTERYNVQRGIICCGGLRHSVEAPLELYDAFVEVCCILLLVGDTFGYFAFNDDGVVDVVRSFGPFLELFNLCVQVAHIWRIVYCPIPSGHFRSRTRSRATILIRFSPVVRSKIADAIFPKQGASVDAASSTLFCIDIKWYFLNTSRSAFGYAVQGIRGMCQPRFTLVDTSNFELFFTTRRCHRVRVEFARGVAHRRSVIVKGSFSILQALAQLHDQEWSGFTISMQQHAPREVTLVRLKNLLRKHKLLVSLFNGRWTLLIVQSRLRIRCFERLFRYIYIYIVQV